MSASDQRRQRPPAWSATSSLQSPVASPPLFVTGKPPPSVYVLFTPHRYCASAVFSYSLVCSSPSLLHSRLMPTAILLSPTHLPVYASSFWYVRDPSPVFDQSNPHSGFASYSLSDSLLKTMVCFCVVGCGCTAGR